MQPDTTSTEGALAAGGAQPDTPALDAGPPGPVVFVIEGRVRPGCEAEFLGLLHPVLDVMRNEPTFINATLHRDPADPTRFLLYETWADLDDVVQVQLARPYRQAFAERLPELLAGERTIGVWQPLRSDPAA